MSRETNVRAAAVTRGPQAGTVRVGHVRKLPPGTRSDYAQGVRQMPPHALNALVDEVYDPSTLAGSAFEVARRESMAAATPVRFTPLVVHGDEPGTWVDVANSDWGGVPQGSDHAAMRRAHAKAAVAALVDVLDRDVSFGGRASRQLGGPLSVDGEQVAGRLAEELWDRYTPREFRDRLSPAQVAEEKADMRDTVLGALRVLGSEDMHNELKVLHRERVASGRPVDAERLPDSALTDAVADRSHVAWRTRRVPPTGAAAAPSVYEDEHGNLVNVNDPDAYVPMSVMEQVRERTQRELTIAFDAASGSTGPFKKKLDREIAREIFVDESAAGDARMDPDFRAKAERAFDALPSEARNGYVERATRRREQLKEFGVRRTEYVPGPRYL